MKALKLLRQWICWNVRRKDERTTKVPCAPDGGTTGTNIKHAHTWATYDEAMAAMHLHGHTGVGFVIPRGYFFLDVDHRSLSDPLLQSLLKRFPTYAERSFSGNGLHIYGRCELTRLPVQHDKLDRSYYTKNPNNGLKLYISGLTNRFAVFTGNAIRDVPLTDCTNAILTLLEQDMRREDTACPAPLPPPEFPEVTEETIFEIVTALQSARNGDKFKRLYVQGDITGYGSHAEADTALCAMIALRAGPHAELIDAIFRRPALNREEKWERDDYRDGTIRCGTEACRSVFHHSVLGKPSFIVQHPRTGAETVCATRLAQLIRQTPQYIFVQDGVYQMRSRTMMPGVIKEYITAYNEHPVKTGTLNEVYELLLTDKTASFPRMT